MKNTLSPDQICFGLNHQLDQSSISCYLQLIGRQELADTLASRLSGEEIEEILNLFSRLLKKHLSENEYHTIFLQR